MAHEDRVGSFTFAIVAPLSPTWQVRHGASPGTRSCSERFDRGASVWQVAHSTLAWPGSAWSNQPFDRKRGDWTTFWTRQRLPDAGAKIAVRVTLTRSGYETVVKTSTAATIAKLFAKVSTPKISGTAKVGKKLTASITVSPSAATSYRWYVNGTAVPGAKSATYTVRKADAGKKVTVKVTVSRSGYQSVSKVSAPKRIAK